MTGPRGPRPGTFRRVPTASGLPEGFDQETAKPPFTGLIEAKQHFPVRPRVFWGLDYGQGGMTACVLTTRDAAGQVQVLQTFTAEEGSAREAALFDFLREFVCLPEAALG